MVTALDEEIADIDACTGTRRFFSACLPGTGPRRPFLPHSKTFCGRKRNEGESHKASRPGEGRLIIGWQVAVGGAAVAEIEVPGPDPDWQPATRPPYYTGKNPASQYSLWEHSVPLFQMIGALELSVQPVAERLRLHVERSWDALDELDVVLFRLASRSASTTAIRSASRTSGSLSRTSKPTRPWTPCWRQLGRGKVPPCHRHDISHPVGARPIDDRTTAPCPSRSVRAGVCT